MNDKMIDFLKHNVSKKNSTNQEISDILVDHCSDGIDVSKNKSILGGELANLQNCSPDQESTSYVGPIEIARKSKVMVGGKLVDRITYKSVIIKKRPQKYANAVSSPWSSLPFIMVELSDEMADLYNNKQNIHKHFQNKILTGNGKEDGRFYPISEQKIYDLVDTNDLLDQSDQLSYTQSMGDDYGNNITDIPKKSEEKSEQNNFLLRPFVRQSVAASLLLANLFTVSSAKSFAKEYDDSSTSTTVYDDGSYNASFDFSNVQSIEEGSTLGDYCEADYNFSESVSTPWAKGRLSKEETGSFYAKISQNPTGKILEEDIQFIVQDLKENGSSYFNDMRAYIADKDNQQGKSGSSILLITAISALQSYVGGNCDVNIQSDRNGLKSQLGTNRLGPNSLEKIMHELLAQVTLQSTTTGSQVGLINNTKQDATNIQGGSNNSQSNLDIDGLGGQNIQQDTTDMNQIDPIETKTQEEIEQEILQHEIDRKNAIKQRMEKTRGSKFAKEYDGDLYESVLDHTDWKTPFTNNDNTVGALYKKTDDNTLKLETYVVDDLLLLDVSDPLERTIHASLMQNINIDALLPEEVTVLIKKISIEADDRGNVKKILLQDALINKEVVALSGSSAQIANLKNLPGPVSGGFFNMYVSNESNANLMVMDSEQYGETVLVASKSYLAQQMPGTNIVQFTANQGTQTFLGNIPKDLLWYDPQSDNWYTLDPKILFDGFTKEGKKELKKNNISKLSFSNAWYDFETNESNPQAMNKSYNDSELQEYMSIVRRLMSDPLLFDANFEAPRVFKQIEISPQTACDPGSIPDGEIVPVVAKKQKNQKDKTDTSLSSSEYEESQRTMKTKKKSKDIADKSFVAGLLSKMFG